MTNVEKIKGRLLEMAFEEAKAQGAEHPVLAESSDDSPVILDMYTGDCYRILVTVEEF